MRNWTWLFLAACATSPGGDGDGSGSGSGSGSGVSSCTVTAFTGGGVDFALPDLHPATDRQPFEQLAGQGWINDSDTFQHALVDLDGDGKQDIVVSSHSSDPTVGRTHWVFYKNTGKGFDGARDFALPDLGAVTNRQPFEQLAGQGWINDSDTFQHALVDVDGDSKPDLVLTSRSSDTSLGRTRWVVYPNTGTGFDGARDLGLPGVGAASNREPFEQLAGQGWITDSESMQHSLLDLDGDHKPDIVMTSRTTDTTLGSTRWVVFKGTGTGFDGARDVGLPALGATADRHPFEQLAGQGWITDSESMQHWLVDLDGDGKPDIVISSRTSDPAIGRARWVMFKNNGAGFDGARDIALPDLGAAASRSPFEQLAGQGWITDSESMQHSLLDLDGDGKPDIVLTERGSDPALGATRWAIFKNTGAGFDGKRDFALPDFHPTAMHLPLDQLAGQGWINDNDTMEHWLVDLDGDHKLDVIITSRSTDATVGAAHWRTYNGVCQ